MDDFSAAVEAALSKFDGSNFHSLTEREKVVVTIWGIEAEVNNGGFDQYYFNGAGDQAHFAPHALATIGAHQMAAIVSRANAVFGPEGPPRSADARQAKLLQVAPEGTEPWDALDQEFQAYPDDISSLLGRYLGVGGAG